MESFPRQRRRDRSTPVKLIKPLAPGRTNPNGTVTESVEARICPLASSESGHDDIWPASPGHTSGRCPLVGLQSTGV